MIICECQQAPLVAYLTIAPLTRGFPILAVYCVPFCGVWEYSIALFNFSGVTRIREKRDFRKAKDRSGVSSS